MKTESFARPHDFCSALRRVECMASDNSAGGGAFDWNGLFSAASGAATNIINALNAPPKTAYNPGTGQYTPAPGTAASVTAGLSQNTGLFLLLGFGLVAILLLKR